MNDLIRNVLGGIAGGPRDPYFNYTTLLLPGTGTNGAQNGRSGPAAGYRDGTFLDSSSNNFTITRNGNTTQGTFSPFSQTGWSNYFSSSASLVTPSTNGPIQFEANAFTIEFWIYPLALSGRSSIFSTTSAHGTGPVIAIEGNGVNFNVNSSIYGSAATLTTTNIGIFNTWQHIAVVRTSTASNNAFIYINGILNATGTISNNFSTAYNINIGHNGVGPEQYYGYISNLRVIKGQALYTGNFTPATSALTANTVGATGAGAAASITGTVSLLTCQSNRFVDNSSNNFTLTSSGTPSVQAFSPFAPTTAYSAAVHGGSGYFDGTLDYLTADNLNIGNFGTNDFTIECWFYANDLANYRSIVESRTSNATTTGWTLAYDASGNIYLYSNAYIVTSGTGALRLQQWNHVAVTRQSGTTRLFLNGALTQSSTTSRNYTDNNFKIATRYDNASEYFNGYISSLRIVKNTAVYTSAFALPTAPLTATTNTSLLLNFTNAAITDATAKNVLETVGNAQISTAQSKWGGGSMYFDGSGDYLESANFGLLNLGTADFTIEAWGYITASGRRVLIEGLSGSTVKWKLTTDYSAFGSSNNNYTAWPLNNWIHIAFVRYSGVIKLYINGILYHTMAGATTDDITRILIGKEITNTVEDWPGYISDLRITKGVARYTANFTPPTTPFALR